MYAVVRTGGKQYRVEEGRAVTIERLTGEPGDTVELGDVLLMADGADVTVGAPVIAGARVLGTIAEQGRAKKIIVFRYKAKTRARKKTGHRQQFTRLIIEDILAPGQEPKPKAVAAPAEPTAEEAPKGRRRRGKTATTEAPVPETEASAGDATAEAPMDAAEANAKDTTTVDAGSSTEPETAVEESHAPAPKRRSRKKDE